MIACLAAVVHQYVNPRAVQIVRRGFTVLTPICWRMPSLASPKAGSAGFDPLDGFFRRQRADVLDGIST